jgi:hypothetical protein
MPSSVIDDAAFRQWCGKEGAFYCGLFPVGHRGADESTAGTKTARGAGLRRRFCWGVHMDNSFLEEQAARCRQLAERSDPFTKRRLLHLAANYEDRLLGKPSRATRRLANLPTELPHAPSLRSDG